MTDYFADFTNDNGVTQDELGVGFDTYTGPSTRVLEGRTLTVHCEDGVQLQYAFLPNSVLRVGESGGAAADEEYVAYEEAEGVVLVSHRISPAELPTNRFLILDLPTSRALVFTATITDQTGPRGESAVTILQAGIDAPVGVGIPEADDLVGKRAVWGYSPDHLFEHIYYNRNTFVWACIKGAEVNQVFAEKAVYFKIRDGVYVLYWKQGKWADEIVGLINFNAGHLTLSSFGWNADTQSLSGGAHNGYGRVLNDTRYDTEDVLASAAAAYERAAVSFAR